MATAQNPPQGDEQVDLSALFGIVIDRKWLIIVVTALFFLVSAIYTFFATPIYQANAIVQVEQKTPSLPGLTDLTQTLGTSTSQATTEIALITSRTVIGKAVANLKLDIQAQPLRFPLIGDSIARRFKPAQPDAVAGPWLGMNSYDWGGAQLDIFQLKVPFALQGRSLTLIAAEHGAYTLRDDHDDVLLQGVAGETASGHGVTMQVKTLRANPGTHFNVSLSRPLATVTGLQGSIKAVEQGANSGIIALTYNSSDPVMATKLLDQISQIYVQQNVDRNSAEAANSLKFVREQLPMVRRDLEKATEALNAFQISANSVDITMQTQGLLGQEVAIEASIQQLHMQQVEMARLYTSEHPAYKALMQQLGQLQSQKAALEKQVGGLPDTQQQLLRLTRDVQVSNQTYTSLLNQDQQLDIARAGTVGNVRIVDMAAVDTTNPVNTKAIIVILVGTLIGAFLAIGFVFLRQLLNRGVEDPTSIEQLGLAVYAAIPVSEREQTISLRGKHAKRDGRQHLLAVEAPADLAVEALRSLRTSLHFARLEAKNNVLMISGSSPEAGKTFISANLAAVIAQGDQRVLLIDGDLRKGALHKLLGGKAEGGLSDLISGQIDLAAAIRPVTSVEKLHFIARGKVPPNPSELLMNARFSALLEKLMPLYDLIVIDTPPILAVTDAAVIGHLAGTSLLVVRFALNQAREIALAKQRFEHNGVEIKGAIFNAVEKRSAGYYSYGYYEYNTGK